MNRRLGRFRELAPFLGVSRRAVVLLVGSSVLAGFVEAAVLALVAYTATALSGAAQDVHVELAGVSLGDVSVPLLLAVGFALVVVRLTLQEVGAYLPARMVSDLQADLRTDLWAGFLAASWDVQSRDRDGKLQNVLTSQVMHATQAVLMFANGVAAAVTFAALVASSLLLNVLVAGLTIAAAAILFAGLRPLTQLARRHAQYMSAANVEFALGIGEGVRLAEEIKVFDVADAEHWRARSVVDRIRHGYFRTQLLSRNIVPLYQTATLLIILGGLGVLYMNGTGRVAALGAIVLILIRALNYSQTVQGAYHIVHESLPFVDLVKQARDAYSEAGTTDGDMALPSLDTVDVRDVSFAYVPGRDVLSHVSFRVDAGESIGIVGPSGAGKSTMLELLLRLRSPREGEIAVNDLPTEGIMRSDWFRRVAYVPQESRLLHGTVRDNIGFFRSWIDDDAVEEAAHRARIHDDIAQLPDTYATVIGQRADTVSGGQRQRLCLARALAGQPDLLLLDEPTSALDLRSEALVQQSLSELHGRVTMMIVAHRLTTLKMCDRIMVFSSGRLEAFATANELALGNAFFRDSVSLSRAGHSEQLP